MSRCVPAPARPLCIGLCFLISNSLVAAPLPEMLRCEGCREGRKCVLWGHLHLGDTWPVGPWAR
jgi:hypothetical protein